MHLFICFFKATAANEKIYIYAHIYAYMGVFCDFQVCMTEKDERRISVCELEFKLRVEFMGEFFFFTLPIYANARRTKYKKIIDGSPNSL